MTPVLDASLFVAAISPAERHHRQAQLLFESHPEAMPYLVPALFRVEVIAALARRAEPLELLETVDALIRGPRFHVCPLDEPLLEKSVHVARVARVRAYDAVYVALALTRGESLFTLDAEMVSRSLASFPDLRVIGID